MLLKTILLIANINDHINWTYYKNKQVIANLNSGDRQ
jgi:hypothetical protein